MTRKERQAAPRRPIGNEKKEEAVSGDLVLEDDADKLHLFSLTKHRINRNCYRPVCATCFGMYTALLELCQYKTLRRKIDRIISAP